MSSLHETYNESYEKTTKLIKELKELEKESKIVQEIGEKQQKIPIDEVIKSLYLRHAFYGYILSKVQRCYSYSIPTAAVTLHRVLKINPEFFASLDKTGQMAILEHECLHLAFLHMTRFTAQMQNPTLADLANIAMDCAINQLSNYDIDKNRFVSLEKVREMTKNPYLKELETAEYYFKALIERRDDVEKELKNDPKFQQLLKDISKGHKVSFDESTNENGTIDPIIESAMRNLLQNAKEYHTRINNGIGTTAGNELLKLLPRYVNIDKQVWRRAINKQIGEVPTANKEFVYNKPNRRNKFSNWGSKHTLENNKLYVGLDTSGSVTLNDLELFLGHISKAIKSCDLTIDLLECDTELHIHENLKTMT